MVGCRLVLLVVLLHVSDALNNGVGMTPPMGFNPWNCFGISSKGTCKLPLPWSGGCHGFNETVILQIAHAFVKTGLKDAGYEYVNLDCGYSTGFRQPNGTLTVNATRYPHGMHWLGDQIHNLGLKFGMYSDAGPTQCCSRIFGPKANDGSLQHETVDAELFASWGVDYLKHDNCGSEKSSYPSMRDALNKTGRPIYYSVHGPTDVGSVANCWRTTPDINNTWASIVERAIMNDQHASSAGPGAFNDPDMLEVGNLFGALGDNEGRSHFSMWAVMKAPLLIGTDVTNMTQATLQTLTNTDVVSINQDKLGIQAKMLSHQPSVDDPSFTFAGPLTAGETVALIVNNRPSPQDLHLLLADVVPEDQATYHVQDLWKHSSVGTFHTQDKLSFPAVAGHDCVLVRISAPQ